VANASIQMRKIIQGLVTCGLACLAGLVFGANTLGDARAQEEALRQVEIQRRASEQLKSQAESPTASERHHDFLDRPPILGERPCVVITSMEILGDDAARFSWLQRDFKPFAGLCLGGKSIEVLLLNLNDRLLQQGFVTTRVQPEVQQLGQGVLKFRIHAGKISSIILRKEGEYQHLPLAIQNAMPAGPGGILNAKDLDQSVENIERLPKNGLRLFIEPANEPGASRVVAEWNRGRLLQSNLTMDNSSSPSLGRWRLSASASLVNPLGLADELTLSSGSNIDRPGESRRALANTVSYSLPVGYHRFSAWSTVNRSGQHVEGTAVNFLLTGYDKDEQIKWQWQLWRQGGFKVTAEVAKGRRTGASHIEDVELIVQRRNARTESLGVNLEWRGDGFAFFANLSETKTFRRWDADEVPFREGEPDRAVGRRISGQFIKSLSADTNPWQYTAQWDVLGTISPTPLSEVMALGGRYSVRGYTGDHTVVASDGASFRNEILLPGSAWPCVACRFAMYIGFDVGKVWGKNSPERGRFLSGAVAGARIQYSALSMDLALGVPLVGLDGVSKPYAVPYISATVAL
jgi:hemolysin activation/secretion protein